MTDGRFTATQMGVWFELLTTCEIRRHDVVLILRPTAGAGLFDALALCDFAGTVILLEQNPEAERQATRLACEMLPQAQSIHACAIGEDLLGRHQNGVDVLIACGEEVDDEIVKQVNPRLIMVRLDDVPDNREKNTAVSLPSLIERKLRFLGEDPLRWRIVRHRPRQASELMQSLPGAVARLGESVFATMNAWPLDPTTVEILYVNSELLGLCLCRPCSDEQAREFVRRHLLLTLTPPADAAAESNVQVYVDRQDDPMKISLVGNSGSGRAVYVGDRFNIKGIGKTVLATSTDEQRSNGALDLVGALWEMLCSNVVYANLRTGAAPTLAVIDLKREIKLPWYDDLIPAGMSVRLDINGELDRPSHLFYRRQPVRRDRLLRIASAFGAQDAEKFIERILHGGWSAGNISINGSMIDYDSVFAIRGRAPQWSFRPNWISNYFGLEELGQKKLLQALAEHELNTDQVPVEELTRTFDDARDQQLRHRLLDLMGISPGCGSHIDTACAGDLTTLAADFRTLAMKMYPNFAASAPWARDNRSLSVFDLSRFFRLYPLAAQLGCDDEETVRRLLLNPAGKLVDTVETQEGGMPEAVRTQLLRDYALGTEEKLREWTAHALAFADRYKVFLKRIIDLCNLDAKEVAVRAYLINEERTYLNSRPGHDVLIAIMQQYRAGRLPPDSVDILLKLIIEACDRVPRADDQGRYRTNMTLYLNGYTSHLLTMDGMCRAQLVLLPTHEANVPYLNARHEWQIEMRGERRPCETECRSGYLHVVSPEQPMELLLTEEIVASFFCDGQLMNLLPITRLDRR